MSVKHIVKVRNRFVTSETPNVISNGINSDEIVLDLDDEWNGLDLTIYLGVGDKLLKTKYTKDSPCYIPSVLITNPGDRISFSLVGEDGDRTTRLVTSLCTMAFTVVPSGAFKI